MVVKKLLALADSLDKKGHKELANAVDQILKSYAEDEDASEESEETESEETESEETEEADPEDAESEQVVVEDAAPAGEGMLGDSWYGEKGATSPDLSPPPPGTMLDKRDPSLSCSPPAAPAAPAAPAEGAEESDEEVDEAPMMAYKVEVAKKLASLADALDKKGLIAEANFVDKACKSVLGE